MIGKMPGIPMSLTVTTLDTTFAKNSKEDIVDKIFNSRNKIPWKNIYRISNPDTTLYNNLDRGGHWGNAVALFTNKNHAVKLKIDGETYYKYTVVVHYWIM